MLSWLVDARAKLESVRLAGSMGSEKVSSIGSLMLTSVPGCGADGENLGSGSVDRDLNCIAVECFVVEECTGSNSIGAFIHGA